MTTDADLPALPELLEQARAWIGNYAGVAPGAATICAAIDAAVAEARAVPDGWTDADADAARLALELECLLTDKDVPMPALSRWWDSAHEALRLHRERLAATPEPPEFGCCLPEGECHTAADYERQHGVDWRRADDMRAEHDAEMRRDAFGLP